jgi:hypothetical protein
MLNNKKGSVSVIALSLLGFVASQSLPVEDRVTSLLNQPKVGQSFDLYSGYLNITHTKKALHYVAAMSQN